MAYENRNENDTTDETVAIHVMQDMHFKTRYVYHLCLDVTNTISKYEIKHGQAVTLA